MINTFTTVFEMATGSAASTLRRFELDGVCDTGREVGHGSYAVVKELRFRGLKCVGKKIHDILFNSATPQEQAAILECFVDECVLLGGLHHPCIVQFLGVCFEQGSPLPVLVMEYLHTTLSACLERYGILPKEISYGILRDVALGLRYLHEHSPPIIHRDLSANNILLTSNMNAKLSDLGVAKMLNLTPARMTQMTQTKAPGNPCYMPPEALTAKPKYTSKIDIYSYGVLIIHTLCGRWPFPEDVFRPDPRNPDAMIPISEVERRAEYLQEIGNDHPLMGLIRQCLSNMPARRPEAHKVVSTIMSRRLPAVPNMIELLRNAETKESERSEIDTIRSENETIKSENQSLRSENETIKSENPHLRLPRSELQPQLLHPLQWKKCADILVGMHKPQAVVMGEKVYVRGGFIMEGKDTHNVFQYNTSEDEWRCLLPHPLIHFAMAPFKGKLITVGGRIPGSGSTGKVYHFKEESQEWEEFFKPMPTARYLLTVATTQSAIIAIGGATHTMGTTYVPCPTVEVYSSETSQWYTADPLPGLYLSMSSVTIADTCYLLGGNGADGKAEDTVLCVSLTSLVQKAISPTHQSTSHTSVWKTLPNTPNILSAAASLNGHLLAVGGYTGQASIAALTVRMLAKLVGVTLPVSSALHVFLPLTNSWVRVTDGDLPQPRFMCTAVQLSSNTMIVIGGMDDQMNPIKTVYIGTVTV